MKDINQDIKKIENEMKKIENSFNQMYPNNKNYDEMKDYKEFSIYNEKYDKLLDKLGKLRMQKAKEKARPTKKEKDELDILRETFPKEDLSNYGYAAYGNLNMPPQVIYFSLKELYSKKNHLIQITNNMNTSQDRKNEIIDSINKVYNKYISEQEKREKPNNKFKSSPHKEEKIEKKEQNELDIIKQRYGFDDMSEEEQEEFMDKFNNRFEKEEEDIERVEGHRIM